jgi:hypothetical protein
VNIWEEYDNEGKVIVKPAALLSNFLDYEKNENDSDYNPHDQSEEN